jgi:hypothetical protein
MAIAALACAACSGTARSTAPSPTPSVAKTLAPQQAVVPLLECFVSHRLIPFSSLRNGKVSNPPDDYSTWYRDGKVLWVDTLGAWLRVNEGVVVKGKTIGNWIDDVEANRKAWPTSICGPLPAVK